MKKLLVVLFISIAIVNDIAGQTAQLIIKSGSKGLYLDHTVAAKEGLFSIGRIYNVHPRFIAAYNNLDFNKGLNIGQVIRIPLTDTNFTQKKKGAVPIYYKAGDKENLQKISNANNKVLIKDLRDWNKFYKDTVAAGTKLIVGYLVADKEAVVSVLKRTDSTLVKTTPGKLPVTDTKSTGDNPVVKNEPKKDDPAKAKNDKLINKTDTVSTKLAVKKETVAEKPVKDDLPKEEPKKIEPAIVKQDMTANMSVQGYFKSYFDQQVKTIPVSKTETVTSGIFKMVSVSQDAKYYLLADAVPSGTIVRIINPENNKTVYAKVLGDMSSNPAINAGLNIRISNTAASALGISDTEKFIVTVNY